MSSYFTKFIYDPSHFLGTRTHIRRWNVFIRSKNIAHGQSIPTRQTLQFTLTHATRVALDTTLRTTIRHIHYSTFPCHPCRQCLHLIQVHIHAVTDTTLRRTQMHTVNHAVSLKHTNGTIIHRYWDVGCHHFVWYAQYVCKLIVQS